MKSFTLTYIEGSELAQQSVFSSCNRYSSFAFHALLLQSLLLFFLSSDPPLLHVLLSIYISPSMFHPHHTRVGWVRGISFCPIQRLLELPMGNCKAASLLFRYHLHINAVRELVERQLMRRQLQLQIFVCLFFLTLGLLSHLQW